MADQVLQDIKDRLNIADVIAGYIPIKKAGTSFKALCPFHHEKSPSLQISPQKQIWHCFGCGEGGDVFGFVIKYENVEFKEALKILADKAGIKLPEYKPTNKTETDEKEILIRINNFAARFYHEILCSDTRGKEALAYLLERGLNKNTIDKWQIGFAPEDFHSLKNALTQKQVSEFAAIKSGVLIKNERGQVYDRFRGRITFPICNHFGETVGFTARILPRLDDGKMGKYINSPETPVYNKSKILFGLNFAKNTIRKLDEVIIVEGQMDVITASQAGYENLVASSGTALTQDQLNALSRLTKNLKFCFDGDKAGILATRRAVENYLGQDFSIKIIELPEAKDPDELIKKSPEIWEKQTASAKLFLDYFIDKSFEHFASSSIEQKKQVAKDLLPLIKKLTDPLEQDHYLQLLASRFGTIVNVLKQALQKIIPPNTKSSEKNISVPTTSNNLLTLEKNVLGGMLMKQKFLQTVVTQGSVEDFTNPEIKDIALLLFNGETLNPEVQNSTLAKEALFMVELQSNEAVSTEAFEKDLTKAFFLLRLNFLKKQLQRLTQEIKQAELSGNKELLQSLNSQFANFSNLRIKYEKQI
jgi:DNA primase